ncbi:MAG TPA: hypothetical protein H9717_08275 [Candidatus Eisenbergiella merdipullorum]|uniref:Uncharacterized protein n=1 Tax=Candidatus Eisenbergiella merdipullorum TaxID=2838553 RepID=A0A9D2L162_9FIRM|nr:hypothetical protein [Candidatus Eisenbergiella merdipullorum]
MGQILQENGRKGKRGGKECFFRKLAVLAAAVFLFEIFIGNYSSVRSLFFQKTDLTDRMELTWGEAEEGSAAVTSAAGSTADRLTVVIDGLDMRIDNLYFNLEMPANEAISISISLTDEGNRYLYPLPEMEAVGRYPSSLYTNLYPYGKVHSLTIELEPAEGGGLVLSDGAESGKSAESGDFSGQGSFALLGLEANVFRPFDLVLPRMLLLFGIGAFCLFMRENSGVFCVRFDPESRRQNLITAGCLVLFFLFGLMLVLADQACVESPWEHQQQYRQLASAILEGHVWVGRQPELMELENPYDTSYLLAGNIPYLADYAYYEGNYYVYFGIVPELLFYLPCLAVTGKSFPNFLAVYFCFSGFALSVFGLYREAVRRWFSGIPYVFYLTAAGVTLTFGSFIYLTARPDMYHVPLMAANMFTAAGIWLWLCGLNRERGRKLLFGAGSACMALVAGCRPQMLAFSVIALPLFWGRFFGGNGQKKREKALEAAVLLVPYAIVAAGIMYYNALRFSSPFDFGAAYSLTNNDMTHRGTNLSRILYGLCAFFFLPARYEAKFPFLMTNGLENEYMGKMVSEFLFGGILASQSVCWCLALFPVCRRKISGGKELSGILMCALGASLVIGAFDANAAGILQRYTADAALGIALASCLMMLFLFHSARGVSFRYGLIFLRAALLQHALYAFLIVFASGDSVNLKNYGRILYYGAKRLFQM